jgi:hypothetical protein
MRTCVLDPRKNNHDAHVEMSLLENRAFVLGQKNSLVPGEEGGSQHVPVKDH